MEMIAQGSEVAADAFIGSQAALSDCPELSY